MYITQDSKYYTCRTHNVCWDVTDLGLYVQSLLPYGIHVVAVPVCGGGGI